MVYKKTKELIFSALFTAIICIFSQIVIPTPSVPITLQVFIICLCGYCLGAKYSLFSILGYIILGFVGVPVFCGFQGGAQHILGFTGGFIIGFLPLAFLCGITHKFKTKFMKILLSVLGVIVCHTLGVVQFSIVSSNHLLSSFIISSAFYLLKDISLCVLAFFLSEYIKKIKSS